METVMDNIKYIETVKQLKEKSKIIDLYNTLKDNIYVNYKIDIRKMSENISSFENLSITDMQSFILDIVDQNALYLNYSEIMDSNHNISAETIKLNTSFYQ
jgi:adenine-specific DNA-methyltransferase